MKLGTKHVLYQKLVNLCRKMISMLTVFNVPSLASKSVFYSSEHKTNGGLLKWNFEVLGMQRQDKPTGRTQRKDEKWN